MNHIIESIGAWGVVTTPTQVRIGRVKPGDIIQVPESLRRYPCEHEFSRIASINEDSPLSEADWTLYMKGKESVNGEYLYLFEKLLPV